jgi:hypothetical protein
MQKNTLIILLCLGVLAIAVIAALIFWTTTKDKLNKNGTKRYNGMDIAFIFAGVLLVGLLGVFIYSYYTYADPGSISREDCLVSKRDIEGVRLADAAVANYRSKIDVLPDVTFSKGTCKRGDPNCLNV